MRGDAISPHVLPLLTVLAKDLGIPLGGEKRGGDPAVNPPGKKTPGADVPSAPPGSATWMWRWLSNDALQYYKGVWDAVRGGKGSKAPLAKTHRPGW